MTRQAQVGAFAILALLLLFGVFYVITDFGTRHTGYRIGVHFQSAAGVTPGGQVYFSGVNVGSVDSVELLADNTVDLILAINHGVDIPVASTFLIEAPLTGSPSVVIIPPRKKPPLPVLPRQVLPIADQPQGRNSASIGDLLAQGQTELRQFSRVMSMFQRRAPKLLDTLQTTLNNANDLTVSTKAALDRLSNPLIGASQNFEQLSATLNDSATVDSKKVGALLDQFQSTSVALNRSMVALEGFATNPRLKANILATTQNIADATQTLAELTNDLRSVTSNPQTQEQIRNTIANLDAVMQKANSLLGELGGKSSVYGVDAGATPAPITVPSSSPYPGTQPAPAATGMSPELRSRLQGKLSELVHNFVAIQLRMSGLSPPHNLGINPVLTSSQGPLGDLNLVFLPHGSTSVIVGANAIGTNTTWNAILQKNQGEFHLGAGVLYSQLGILGQYAPLHGLGFETRIYGLNYPMIDLYGNIHVAPGAELFFGQRDVTHASRRNTFGFQYQF